jgi:Rrf2 family transcriptional regulator, iron-sulfur cluster assembly transcription factor
LEIAMRMSTKGRFAVNAMIDLALRDAAGPVALASISQRQEISLSYLEQLFSRLRKQSLVESTRGPGGGYTLARAAGQITVADIVLAVEDPQEDGAEDGPSLALSKGLWERLHKSMLEQMATITLQSLVDEQVASGAVVTVAPPVRRAIAPLPVAKLRRPFVPNSVFAFGRSFAT